MGKVKKFKRKKFVWLKRFLLISILLGMGYFFLFHYFRVNQIEIVGSDRYNEEQMKEYLIKDKLDHNTLYCWIKYKYREKPSIPFVQDIGIEMKDRNTIQVTVYEKRVTGCVEFMGEYMYFDKDGIVVEAAKEREDKIPLVIGLKFTRIAMNEELQIQKQAMFKTILDFTRLISQYQLDVSEIIFNKDYEVSLTCGNSVVLLGKHEFYDFQLSQLNNILAESKGVAYTYYMQNYTDKSKDFYATKMNEKKK